MRIKPVVALLFWIWEFDDITCTHSITQRCPCGTPWNVLQVSSIFSVHTWTVKRVCILCEYKWQVEYSMVYHKESVLYSAIENTVANTVNVVHKVKVGLNTFKYRYTMAVLYSDWLYILLYGIKHDIFVSAAVFCHKIYTTPLPK